MKEELLIADCLGKHDGKGNPFGHYLKAFEQYYQLLKNDFEVSLGITKEYKRKISFCDSFFIIRFGQNYGKTCNRLDKYSSLLKEIINVIMVLNSKYSIVIFQQTNFIFSLIPLMFYLGKKKIFFIIYKDYLNSGGMIKRLLKRFIYSAAKRKIKGLIVGMEEVGKIYNHNYLVMPDYIFNSKFISHSAMPIKYDIAVVGIINSSKNVIDVVSSFYKTKYRIIIAGKFKDNEQYKKACQFNSENITIINEYINKEKYSDILESTKYVALPYDPLIYTLNSSGVFYDAIYHFKPLIASNTKFFERVRANTLGYVYVNSINESINILDDSKIYKNYVDNIKNYVKKINRNNKNKLIDFLQKHI